MKNLARITVAVTFALGGCAATPLEVDYGQSVRQMGEYQVYNHATLARPSVLAVEGADPDMITLAMKTMRTEAIDRQKVSQPLIVNVGGQGGQ